MIEKNIKATILSTIFIISSGFICILLYEALEIKKPFILYWFIGLLTGGISASYMLSVFLSSIIKEIQNESIN